MQIHLEKLLVPLGLALVTAIVLLIIRTVLFRLFHRWAVRSGSHLDDLIIRSIRIPSVFWCLAIGLYIGIDLSEYSGKYLFYLSRTIHLLLIFSITLAIANLAGKLFTRYFQNSQMPIPATGLVQGLLQGIFWAAGLIIILNFLGIPITPLITALGVGGLAMALALQDTLANFFAGIHIMMEKSVRVGDFVKLESGQEGVVEDISWRTTRLKTLSNNLVIIPNHKFSQSIVTNYSFPEKRMSLSIPISVSYQSEPEKVEAILTDAAKMAVGEIPGLLGHPEPLVRFSPGFGESSLDFTLICQVEEFVDQYLVQHELRKRIFRRLKEEGLEIPFPQRTVYIREEKNWKDQGRNS